MVIQWPDFTLPPINQPVLMPALEFHEMIRGDKMTIEIDSQQKQLDVARNGARGECYDC